MSDKKFSLTEEEKNGIKFRKTAFAMQSYIASLVDSDLNSFVMFKIGGRLGVKPDAKVKLAEDLSTLEVLDEKKDAKIIVPGK